MGIYCIKNLKNSKCYIGLSVDVQHRWGNHRRLLKHNTHINKYLQNAWNKYGEENFEFSIIEKCSVEDLPKREMYWIEKLDTFKKGYNSSLGGEGTFGYKFTDEQRKKLSDSVKGRVRTSESIEKQKKTFQETIDNGYQIKTEHFQKYNKEKQRKIVCYINGFNLYNVYESVHDASRDMNIAVTKISGVLNKRIHTCIFDDYNIVTFFYFEETISEEIVLNEFKYRNAHLKIKVNKYDENNVLVKSFSSVQDCIKSDNITKSILTNICSGKRNNKYYNRYTYAYSVD